MTIESVVVYGDILDQVVEKYPLIDSIKMESNMTNPAVNQDAGQIKLLHEYSEIEKVLDLSHEGIETTALRALYRGLCSIRLAAFESPSDAYKLADAMHNLPIALEKKDYDKIRIYVMNQRRSG